MLYSSAARYGHGVSGVCDAPLERAHFAEGRYENAPQEADAVDAPGVGVVHLAAAAALSRPGRMDEARARLDEVERLSPGLLDRLRQDPALRQLHPKLVEMIAGAIEDIEPTRAPSIPLRNLKPI